MKRAIVVSFVVFMLLTLYMVSCKHDPALNPQGQNNTTNNPTIVSTNCDPDTVYFQNEVLPIIQSSCAKSGCHDAATQAEGVYLGNYASIMNTGHVTPGNPCNNNSFKRLLSHA